MIGFIGVRKKTLNFCWSLEMLNLSGVLNYFLQLAINDLQCISNLQLAMSPQTMINRKSLIVNALLMANWKLVNASKGGRQ